MNTAKHLLSTGLALAAAGLVSCSIPKPECTIGQSSVNGIGWSGIAAFSARYTLVSGSGECANLKGDVIGFQSFHPASTTGDGKTRDFSKTSIAIRPHSLGELYWMYQDLVGPTEDFCGDGLDNDEDGKIDDADEDCHVNAIGNFAATEPDGSDMCQISEASITSGVNFPGADVPVDTGTACMDDAGCNMGDVCDIPMGETEGTCITTLNIPATDARYEWSNLQIYVTASAVGTQFTADLKFTLNGCEATYKVVGLWPAVDCGVHDPDTFEVTGTDIQFCNPEPDAPSGRPIGSGINPDFGPLACDTGVSVLPVVDDYYTNLVYGFPFSVPRCVLTGDAIPQLGGFRAE